MKLKMLFGTIVSALLAFGVLDLAGMYEGSVTAFGIAAGVLLAAVYLLIFRAAVARNEEGTVVVVAAERTTVPVAEEAEVFVPAAA